MEFHKNLSLWGRIAILSILLTSTLKVNWSRKDVGNPSTHYRFTGDAFVLTAHPLTTSTIRTSRIFDTSILLPVTIKRSSSRWIRMNMVDSVSSPSNDEGNKVLGDKTSGMKRKPNRSSSTVQQELLRWAKAVDIQISPSLQLLQSSEDDRKTKNGSKEVSSGYGWYLTGSKTVASDSINSGQVLLTVPSSVALVVESSDATSNSNEAGVFPWYVKMAVQLHQLKQQTTTISSTNNGNKQLDYRPWIQSLPVQFDTPIHWKDNTMQSLQYKPMQESIEQQRVKWKTYYSNYVKQQQKELKSSNFMSYDQFVWGCECARSRAFAGSYSGTAYNPNIFLFTLLLVTIYVGGNFGTLEQAANGAGVVVAASILKDFVLPKFYPTKKYIICPMIDMTNHNSQKARAQVAFEYFSNVYSLAIIPANDAVSNPTLQPQEQIFMSYGPRSNDQLLQYYGFVEIDNPHDVYILPPVREWDINQLESICGRQFQPGRLQKLDEAGLLGGIRNRGLRSKTKDDDYDDVDDDDKNRPNPQNGVVVSRSIGLDPAILQSLRVLVSTDTEWEEAGRSIGNFSVKRNSNNERYALLVAIAVLEMELKAKSSTIEKDIDALNRMDTMNRMIDATSEEKLAIRFRIEKKKLLQETIERLQSDLTALQ